jgi:outer membrane lipoprotein-sorting protein
MFKSPSGQRIDQADVEYIIKFLYKNIKWIQKRESEFFEEENRIKFMFWARDYVENRNLEKYRVSVSKKNWLPVQIERYDFEGKPIEIVVFKKYTINSHLKDEFLLP